ncbi:hypothetical protein SAMN05216464_102615 [Mucilaginibacter pineti]|uniref:Uncharacterized protein n=1 Tax=Mucilaginibacter pineti TaxID=1391627 RepID=A0A1G6XS81_9SPHI|nr:hypothetical protein [Mucilaginibacter pineti]SDD80247.1 hypothetical protein SAMN05216464_102615 [Mucilaginibacter pineti]
MNTKPIIKPEWIPAAYSGINDTVKVKPAEGIVGVPFYKRLREKGNKKR